MSSIGPSVVTLFQQEWPIPELPIDALMKAWRDIHVVSKALFSSERAQIVSDAGEPTAAKGMELLRRTFELTEDEFRAMCNVVYIGLTVANDISRAEFNARSASPVELYTAFLTVREQSLLYDLEIRKGLPSGEAVPARTTKNLIGISSSSTLRGGSEASRHRSAVH